MTAQRKLQQQLIEQRQAEIIQQELIKRAQQQIYVQGQVQRNIMIQGGQMPLPPVILRLEDIPEDNSRPSPQQYLLPDIYQSGLNEADWIRQEGTYLLNNEQVSREASVRHGEWAANTAHLREIWTEMENSSETWALIIDQEPKLKTIKHFVNDYKYDEIFIEKSAEEYVRIIDDMALNSPSIFEEPFKRVLMMAAILEYDFDNGTDKDELMLKLLKTPEAVRSNKERLGLLTGMVDR